MLWRKCIAPKFIYSCRVQTILSNINYNSEWRIINRLDCHQLRSHQPCRNREKNAFANQPTDQGKASAESMIAGSDLLIQPVVSLAQNVVAEGVAPPVVVAQTLTSPNQRDLVVPHVAAANNQRLSLSPMTLKTAASHGQQSKPPEGDDRRDLPKEIPEGELQFLRPSSAQLTLEIFAPIAQSTSAPQDLQISNVEKSNTESSTPQSYPPQKRSIFIFRNLF
ncbi:OLC1v1031917C1 [Oldenlandia corymbosa var. corymbosa]|uniref:OLC1v1031917C1 n=1 Tax=Oldenlandia corymbosa var. corymbosa TaxID=529605 RepID=A0AAV1CKE2_OLDCO|nr:OLC1v1031917C1 [Oldenlandia corymbosa var. corymbosa]